MTEELVTLETAKLLKEKGFNEYCKYLINDKGLMMETIFRTSKDLLKHSTLVQCNPLPRSGCVKPKTFIYVYITVLVAMDTKYLKLTMELI